MGKTAALKKKGSQSIRSRAAKRETSPSINTDKSLKNAKPPTESNSIKPSVLSVHQGAGVVKSSKRGRKSVLSARARRRQEKGLDRAEAVMDKISLKVEKSKGKARKVQERRKAWEDLNRKGTVEKSSRSAPVSNKENLMDVEESAEKEESSPHVETDVLRGVKSIQIQSPPSLEPITAFSSRGGEGDEETL